MSRGYSAKSVEVGWGDVGVYLDELSKMAGRTAVVRMLVAGEYAGERRLVLSLSTHCEVLPVLNHNHVSAGGYWPNTERRSLAATVYGMCYSLDRQLAERIAVAERQASF